MKQTDYNEMILRHDEQLKQMQQLPQQLADLKAIANDLKATGLAYHELPAKVESLEASRNKVAGVLSIGGIIVGCAVIAEGFSAVIETIGKWIHK